MRRLPGWMGRALQVHSPSGHYSPERPCWCVGPPVKFKMLWGPMRLVRVKSARDHRWPRIYANTYPGCWIGLAAYYRQNGISWLWGRPGGIR